MADRKNRTIYVDNELIEKAIILGKKLDRSYSRIIEYALADYLKKHGIEVSPDESDES